MEKGGEGEEETRGVLDFDVKMKTTASRRADRQKRVK